MNSIPLTREEVHRRTKVSSKVAAKNRRLMTKCGFIESAERPLLYQHKYLPIITDAYVSEITEEEDLLAWIYNYGKDEGSAEIRAGIRKLLRV